MNEPHTQRGATLVEAALILSLILVPLVTGVQAVQARGGERLNAGGVRVGTPVETYTPVTPTTGVVTNPSVTTTVPPVGTVVSAATLQGNATPQNPQRWTATVIIGLLDANGQPVVGATVSGGWTSHNKAEQDTTCTTDGNGRCTVTQWDLRRDGADIVTDTTYTIDDITGPSLSIGPGVTGTAITINKV